MMNNNLSKKVASKEPLIITRPAIISDVGPILEILQPYINQQILLPVSVYQLFEQIRDFVVAEREGDLVGCGSLLIVWHDLAEIRSLAVRKGFTGGGVGKSIVDDLVAEAKKLGLARIFALTYETKFFGQQGFGLVDRETLPHKVWKDCTHCARFDKCDEIAMERILIPKNQRPPDPPFLVEQKDPSLIMPASVIR